MPQIHGGPRVWSGQRTSEGHREYKVTHLVIADVADGPANVLRTPGLPLPGSQWNFLGDADPWAFCQQDATLKLHQHTEGDPHEWWTVEQTFSTRSESKRCTADTEQEDPLLQPPKISVQFSSRATEATHDRFGRMLCTSAWEQLRGPQVEFDETVMAIRIEQNVATFEQAVTLPKALMNAVNDRVLWGMTARTVRLAGGAADIKYYGQCYSYWSRSLEFALDDRTHDRDVLDEGTKMLAGNWATNGTDTYNIREINGAPADHRNPAHFVKAVDRDGNPCRIVLNGAGVPALTLGALNRWFISITGVNAGNALTNMARWIPVSNAVDFVAAELVEPSGDMEWQPGTRYVVGDLVLLTGGAFPAAYVATKNSPGNENPVLFPATWTELTAGVADRGDYNAATTYAIGDYVRAVGASGTAGSIHVSKYPSANLLLLGVPAILG